MRKTIKVKSGCPAVINRFIINKIVSLSFTAMLFFSCGKTEDPALPEASISGISQSRSTANSSMIFKVTLNKVASQDITINYSTSGVTAVADKDFVPNTGMLKIANGTSNGTIEVTIIGGNQRKEEQTFELNLDTPKNCTLVNSKAVGKILNDNGVVFITEDAGYSTPISYPNYKLAWSDEFTGTTINPDVWTFEKGNNNGWGNHELENYTERQENSFVSNGNLIIEARQESYNGSNYTSARMVTKGKKTFTYGRIDIRAKLPKGKGIWPALWMLGNNIDQVNWPVCGEIDIMELLGQEPAKIYGTLHYGNSAGAHAQNGTNYILKSSTFDQQFHVFSLVWTKDVLKILVDDNEYLSVASGSISSNYPFNNPFFFIFNVAVGGDFPGNPDSSTTYPQRMVVDYVRVFQ